MGGGCFERGTPVGCTTMYEKRPPSLVLAVLFSWSCSCPGFDCSSADVKSRLYEARYLRLEGELSSFSRPGSALFLVVLSCWFNVGERVAAMVMLGHKNVRAEGAGGHALPPPAPPSLLPSLLSPARHLPASDQSLQAARHSHSTYLRVCCGHGHARARERPRGGGWRVLVNPALALQGIRARML